MSSITDPESHVRRMLAELEAMGRTANPGATIGRAMADVDAALATTNTSLAALYCLLAAARLVRAAERLEAPAGEGE
jgi:hypothetical protein